MNRSFLILTLLMPCSLAAAGNVSKDAAPSPAPLPAFESLLLEPARLDLQDGRDVRRIIVWGRTKTGEKFDLSSHATLKAGSEIVAIEEGYVEPRKQGEGEVLVSAAGLEAKLPVKVSNAEAGPVRFVRDVLPVLSKAGCNAGTCHGSAKGKNGFKLSLRGYDPEYDYQALINDLSGRRFNRVAVDQSLMLLKPLAEVPHEGRQAIKPGSREHKLLRQWIAEGAKNEAPEAGRANRVEVLPADINLTLPGMTQQLIVLAHYADGSVRDVTQDAVLSSNNEDVVKVKDAVITSQRRGEAAILVRYEGNYAAQEIAVMGDRAGFEWTQPPEYNFVDKLVNAKLQKMKIQPSEVCTDADFIRRVTLDLTGQPPRPDRIRTFLADPTPSREKREKLVDELIGSNDYVQSWASKWADLLQCNSEVLGKKAVWLYRDWIKRALEANKPYDQFVRELLTAQGSSYQNPAVLYFCALREPGKITEDVSQTFLGTRFNCNKCHDHPFEKWTQNQYYQFGAFFSQVAIKRGTLGREVIRSNTGDNMTVTGEEVVYKNYNRSDVVHPKTTAPVQAKVPFGQSHDVPLGEDGRDAFVDWLTSKDNPLFAKSAANRIWSYFFGRGIIDPVDDIRASNPPSNGPLLDALTEDFVKSGFDVRKLMRTICTSRTYQLSILKNKWNEDDAINFSHAIPRRLSAEQLLDAIAVATGHRPNFNGLPTGMRAVELPDGAMMGNDFLTLFGRPKRQSACECERSSNITLSHAMSLINGEMIGEAVTAPDNRLKRIVDKETDNRKVVEEVYLSGLGRTPNEKEFEAVEFTGDSSRLEVAQDLAWALMNSPSFLFNR